jgi:hypothetical protein
MLPPGTILKDNDPRVPEPTLLTVIVNEGDRVLCQRGARRVRINVNRIYTDGKPRRSGFSLVPADQQ